MIKAWILRCFCRSEEADRVAVAVERVRNRKELCDALSGIGPEHPVWRAVREIVRCQYEMELAAALDPELSTEALHRNHGRLIAIAQLDAGLDLLWKETHEHES